MGIQFSTPASQMRAELTQLDPTKLWAQYGDLLIQSGLKIIGALAMLLVGIWIANSVAKTIKRVAQRSDRIDDTLGAFFASIARYGILAFSWIAVLKQFGVDTASLVAVMGAATLAIGLALQGTLGNVAAGVMLVFFRPYKIGDMVDVAGQSGVVRAIDIFTTELASADNRKIIVPNGQAWGATIVNYSALPERRVDVEFRTAYEDSSEHVIGLILEAVREDTRILLKPEAPFVRVTELTDQAVVTRAQVWCRTEDYLEVRFDLIRRVREKLSGQGFFPPYPTQRAFAEQRP